MSWVDLISTTFGTVITAMLVLAIGAFGRAVFERLFGKDHGNSKSW